MLSAYSKARTLKTFVATCYKFISTVNLQQSAADFLYAEGGDHAYRFYFAVGTDHTGALSIPRAADHIPGRFCKIRI